MPLIDKLRAYLLEPYSSWTRAWAALLRWRKPVVLTPPLPSTGETLSQK